MEHPYTTEYLVERGYLNVRDVQSALGLSRSGLHEFFQRSGVEVRRVRIGRSVYYRMEDIDAALASVEGTPRMRAPKRKREESDEKGG